MAEYILDVLSQTSKLDWAFPFQRTGAFPIDRSAMFSSLADAQNYALGVAEGEEAKDARKLGGTSYVGQIISVYEAAVEANEEEGIVAVPASVNAYIITPARGLMKLAATTASGDIGADVADLQGKVNTLISQVEGLQTAVGSKAEKQYVDEELAKKALQADLEEEVNRAKAAEEANAANIEKKADAEQVGKDIAAAIAPLAKQEDVYKKTETYTKTEVETYVQGQIGSAGHLKREIVEALPAVGEANVDTIYMVKKSGGLLDNDHYEEYMVINGAWEMIGDTYVDLSTYATKTYVDGEIDKVEEALSNKADQSALDETNEALATKAEKQYVDDELANKADKTYVDTELGKKANSEQVAQDITAAIAPLATKEYVDDELAKKATKDEHDVLAGVVEGKADKATTLAGYGITDAYTKKDVDDALLLKASQQDHNELVDTVNGKADKATTLEGYGITDAYTKSEVYTKTEADSLLNAKANVEDVYVKDDVYTKQEVNDLLDDKADAATTYSKTEVDNALADAIAPLAVKETVEGQLALKANAADVYSKTETDGLVGAKANSTDVYTKSETDKAIADAVKSATGGESASDVLIALNNYKKAVNAEVWGSEDIADDAFTSTPSRIDALEAVGAQANVIESITIEGEAIAPENKAVALPLALATKAGLVRSAAVTEGKTADNSVSVNDNGYMFVNSVNVNKLVQTTGEYLILNGGGATV